MRRFAYPVMIAAFVLCFLIPLGFHGLWIPDETRNAQIAQDMLHSRDWVVPHLLGLRYFEKPVAGYWMIALSQAVFGENLFGVRFPSALATALSTLLVFFIAQRMWYQSAKVQAATLIYMSFGLVAGLSGYANLDAQFSLWVNLSMVALWFAFDSHARSARLAWWAVLGFACAMGLMTKGFLAWLLPVIVAVPYALLRGRLREVVGGGSLAIVLAVLICLPWGMAIYQREPDFWHFFLWHEHFQRFGGTDAQHARPFWFYVPVLFALCVPWALPIVPALRMAWVHWRGRKTGFLLLWFAMPFLVFSIARGKLPTYLLPCLMPLALLMAKFLVDALERGKLRFMHFNGGLNLALGALLLLALAYVQIFQPLYREEAFKVMTVAVVCVLWMLCGALQMWRPAAFWAAPAIGLWLFTALVPGAMPNRTVNSKMPDRVIIQHMDQLKDSRTLLSNDLGAATALAWRLKRNDIYLLNTEGELEYGLTYPDAAGRHIRLPEVRAWVEQARQQGPIGALLRINSADDEADLVVRTHDAISFRETNLSVLLIPKAAP